MKSCFFMGHRNAPDAVRPLLDAAIERHIVDYGVSEFVVGQHGSFDAMAAAALVDAKRRHPHITPLLLLPYHPAERRADVPEGFDGTIFPDGMEAVPRQFAIVRANRYMVTHCDYLIVFNRGQIGNTRELYELALRREQKGLLTVENLYALAEGGVIC